MWDYLTVHSEKEEPKIEEVVKEASRNLDLSEDNRLLLLREFLKKQKLLKKLCSKKRKIM